MNMEPAVSLQLCFLFPLYPDALQVLLSQSSFYMHFEKFKMLVKETFIKITFRPMNKVKN